MTKKSLIFFNGFLRFLGEIKYDTLTVSIVINYHLRFHWFKYSIVVKKSHLFVHYLAKTYRLDINYPPMLYIITALMT